MSRKIDLGLGVSCYPKIYFVQKLIVKDVRANCFCASLLRTQIHTARHTRARALSNKMRDNRAKGHCYSFAWI